MASYIIKSAKLNLNDTKNSKVTIGKFYSGDRFYTLLNEYIDKNLWMESRLMSWIIKILFRSSNFKHDPGIANGQPWSVRLFDLFCITCLIIFIFLTFGVIGLLIPVIIGFVSASKFDPQTLETMWKTLVGIGVPAVITGVPAILWLVIFFTIRKKNKPLSLQAYVEKKIMWCLKLRFLIKAKKVKIIKEKDNGIFLLENFEAQGGAGNRWLNVQLINLVCSIFPKFNHVFRFEELSDAEYQELKPIMDYDFRMLEIIDAKNFEWNNWQKRESKTLIQKISTKSKKSSSKSSNKKE